MDIGSIVSTVQSEPLTEEDFVEVLEDLGVDIDEMYEWNDTILWEEAVGV